MRITGGEWRGRRLAAPPGRITRPTADRVREAWMSIVAAQLPGARVVDLFAGSGALGLEALSRGAEHAVLVERSTTVVGVLRRNIDALGAANRCSVVRADALRYAAGRSPLEFDVAFADPPYRLGLATRLIEAFGAHPFSRLLGVEHERELQLPTLNGSRTRYYGDSGLSFFVSPAP